MQVSIEATSGLERRLTVGIPAEQFDGEVEKRLKEAAKTVRLNGFRKGKVPLKVVKQRFGASVRQEVMGELINRSFYDAVKEKDVKPAGQPSIEPTETAEGKDFEYVATFEVYPEVDVADMSAFEITKLIAEVGDEDVEKMIDILRKQQGTWDVVERAANDGDQVLIDFVGTKDGEEFAGGKGEDQKLILGSGQMIPGFESGLEGAKAGDKKSLDLTFPDDYHAEDLKGAAVTFEVTVKEVSEQTLPELNEELFNKFGIETDDETVFRTEVKSNMERELKNAAKNKLKTQVMDKLVDANEVEMPKALIDAEIDGLRAQMAQQFGESAQKMDLRSILPDSMFEEQGKRRVALGLIVGEIVKKQDIKVDQDRVKSMVEEIASTYQEPSEVIDYYFSNQQLLASVESVVLEDQVVDHILSVATVNEEQSTYEDVIKPQQEQ
ncbi:trigger factor [Marinibactrum halimedae]|uniref:Trigger factor n=1 Tax=Marinibactrum halimedae TaxID=1444977 RepID=A0AA37T700_9GAMM|nr:trigger factor [Marinibactrum halimedae]MCD9459864.1 trigger factor [Marinibactrum halimedae]GLS26941.1 trigger factor [Marinibactrum halimedae]